MITIAEHNANDLRRDRRISPRHYGNANVEHARQIEERRALAARRRRDDAEARDLEVRRLNVLRELAELIGRPDTDLLDLIVTIALEARP